MGRATNAHGSYPGAGAFATARRAYVDGRAIERMRARGLGVQNIAQQLGCSMEDVRRILAPAPPIAANDAPPAEHPSVPERPALSRTEEEKLFLLMWKSGATRASIMSTTGMSQRRLSALRRIYGLAERTPGRKPGGAA